MNTAHIDALKKYVRAADYLTAAQIYLQDNYLLEQPLSSEHIKRRLLGHWGTCPGINFVYAHLNRLIIDQDLDMMFVLGPGHGFPALQSNLFLEKTLSAFHSDIPRNSQGIAYMSKMFSWPYGSPSHSNPEAPGVILEGGELGYSLATSYGAILDNPDLVVACLVGDGEAETGPTATAWHINKLIDPKTNGAVLPIVHLNGYKISGPTMFGRMSDSELESLFAGYGYKPYFVSSYDNDQVHEDMVDTLNRAYADIRDIQVRAREQSAQDQPQWPVIVLRTPKGWNSIDYVGDKKVEDNHYSHQVIADGARDSQAELRQLEEWMRSYRFDELYDGDKFDPDIESLVPSANRAMGNSVHAHGGDAVYQKLVAPELSEVSYTIDVDSEGAQHASSMKMIGSYMRDLFERNADSRNLRLFSPDETYSNKLGEVFDVTTRAFVWPHKDWDKDLSRDGRVLEMLSEHSLQGMLQGYVLTGRHGLFPSYEAFMQIIASMTDQYAKFLNVARTVSFRGTIASMNYILSSSGWRQEHNGFSHQNPGFIDGILQRQADFAHVYLPVDANTALVVIDKVMNSQQQINAIACGKRELPVWRNLSQARSDVEQGIAVWDFASDDNPHIVFASAGDYVTQEVLAAISIVKQEIPDARIRMVNINHLTPGGIGCLDTEGNLPNLNDYFTDTAPVIVNFHGYAETMKQILFDYGYTNDRVTVNGYHEVGSTTTPFDMMVRNKVDRFNLCMQAANQLFSQGVISDQLHQEIINKYQEKLRQHREYILEYGDDMDEIKNWTW